MDLNAPPTWAPATVARPGGLRVDLPGRTLDRWHPRRWQLRLPLRESGDPVADLIRAHRRVHARGDVRQIRAAYRKAAEMHRGQMRKSGDEYITHPLAVAQILAELGMDTTTLVAALLHDTVEDTSYTLPALESDFGAEVALLVDGVTKFDKAFFGDTAEVETIRKMLVKAGQDVRVLIIKLADRLHNMRTLDARSPASRARIARATLDVLVPLCDRLGIQVLKRSLEDTVLYALEPEAFARDRRVRSRATSVHAGRSIEPSSPAARRSRPRTSARTSAPGLGTTTRSGRTRSPQGMPVDHDLPRIVIVVDGPQTDCYTALGTLHAMWRPVPGRFKDFIASPKNNLYRSLHTTVLGPDDHPVEVLIRTEAMHHAAEYGIVANFRDPQAAARLAPPARAEQLAWLRRVLDWQETVDDAGQVPRRAALRPRPSSRSRCSPTTGRRSCCRSAATPVDLAYTVDPNLGHACVGASVNGRLVPLSSLLDDGDVVEIITRGNSRPARRRHRDRPASGWTSSGRRRPGWRSTGGSRRREPVATVEQPHAARPGDDRSGAARAGSAARERAAAARPRIGSRLPRPRCAARRGRRPPAARGRGGRPSGRDRRPSDLTHRFGAGAGVARIRPALGR